MTPDETKHLLAIAAAFDGRKPSEASIIAWYDAASRGRWTFNEAQEAIKDYYAKTTTDKPWIMPSHITNWIKREREYEAMRYRPTEPEPIDPRVLEAIEQVAETTVIPDEPKPMRNNALSVPCPHCKAQVGQSCTRPRLSGRPVFMMPHPSRKELALDMNKGVWQNDG